MSLTKKIKEFALDLGYSRVGITTADRFSDHVAILQDRGPMYDFLVQDPRRPVEGCEPQKLMPSAKSIISLVWDYSQKAFPEALLGKVGRVYQARSYNAPSHRINGSRYQLMLDFVKKAGCQVGQGIFLPERWVAARAGVTTYGRNNFAYADGIGSFIVLSSIVVDTELEYDTPTLETGCPEGCRACIKACPTQAIYEPQKLNPRRCIAFNAWFTQDGKPAGLSSHIPPEIREKMGTHVHGCDICQEVCPRNRERLQAKLPDDEFLVRVSQDFSLTKMLNMTDEFYETRVQPLMYNYIKEPKYFQRNAAIALGNLGDPAFIPDLELAMNDPEKLVREYAAWALGRIGGNLAKQVLETKRSLETCGNVKKEIEAALLAL
ncbi:epoxyqueuosine reductase [Pelosinus propionicus]|uniref:Epoxyqueuosine reductase n=1 Tax=Pelosinus propionicus DSM 13327 TaxID=1123291 RepID=A0A1I4PN34_9FIRM|nr:4Fe-4S double cluster binding domain-containing protein [Pelosinus propionicus]SFM28873.1 epoxyqueuosine reductase [Pelosinus propionicus DSM 13327]